MKAIILKASTFGTLDGKIMPNDEIMTKVNEHLKAGTAQLLVDTKETLMYRLTEPESNLHPIFKQALKPFGIK